MYIIYTYRYLRARLEHALLLPLRRCRRYHRLHIIHQRRCSTLYTCTICKHTIYISISAHASAARPPSPSSPLPPLSSPTHYTPKKVLDSIYVYNMYICIHTYMYIIYTYRYLRTRLEHALLLSLRRCRRYHRLHIVHQRRCSTIYVYNI